MFCSQKVAGRLHWEASVGRLRCRPVAPSAAYAEPGEAESVFAVLYETLVAACGRVVEVCYKVLAHARTHTRIYKE